MSLAERVYNINRTKHNMTIESTEDKAYRLARRYNNILRNIEKVSDAKTFLQVRNEISAYAHEAGKESVAWCFTTMPSENWKNGVGSALLEYAQGTGDWDAVKTAFVDGWATEYAEQNEGAVEDATEAASEADTEAASEADTEAAETETETATEAA